MPLVNVVEYTKGSVLGGWRFLYILYTRVSSQCMQPRSRCRKLALLAKGLINVSRMVLIGVFERCWSLQWNN